MKRNGATSRCIQKLGNTFLPGPFWPCLSIASLSVPSGMALSPNFVFSGPKLRPLYFSDIKLCGGGGGVGKGINGSHPLLSQLRIMHFNSKLIN